jgi:transposase
MWEPSVNRIIRIGMDTSKSTAWRGCFGTGSAAQAAKKALLEFFAKLPTTVVVIAHAVKLIAPQLMKPYVRRNQDSFCSLLTAMRCKVFSPLPGEELA